MNARRCCGLIVMLSLASAMLVDPALGQTHRGRKPSFPSALSRGPAAARADVGDIAVIVDNGLTYSPRNLFDLAGSMIRFVPTGSNAYDVTRSSAILDPVPGPALTFGYPGATQFPGDDDSQLVAFPAGFPFFGTTYTSVWVNADGNVTFGEPDFASSLRDAPRHALGAPRVSAFLHDWNAQNALNPAGQGSIHAVVKSLPERLVVTWLGVADFEGGVSSTFQLTLYAGGAIDVAIQAIDAPEVYGVVGVAQGRGALPIQRVDLASASLAAPLAAGAIFEAFAQYTRIHDGEVGREFYRTHADRYDFLVVMSDFPVEGFLYSNYVSNQTHGISTPLNELTGEPQFPDTVYDLSAAYGSAGELEQFVFMNNVNITPSNVSWLTDPPIELYREGLNVPQNFPASGGPVTLDGQAMAQARFAGSLPPDDGETSRYFLHDGAFYPGVFSLAAAMTHEVMHRYGPSPRIVHPTKGVGFDSYDLLGRQLAHWSFFVDSTVPVAQFGAVPRCASIQGNSIVDLGTPATYEGRPTNLGPGERLFRTPPTQLADGFSELDQYLMGLRLENEVHGFFYVDEPRSIFTGVSLDAFDPQSPLNTSVTMRAWDPLGGIVFKGRRVDLTLREIQDYEKLRERSANPKGQRFWGPRGNLTVRYDSQTRRVGPAGDASIVLGTDERRLGDEADAIGYDGKPTDVKTMAFVLLLRAGQPTSNPGAVQRMDQLRTVWQVYANGPATAGRGRFDTRLDPPVH